MLKATFKSYYRKKGSRNPIFVYTVIGTAKELLEFAQAKADSQGMTIEDYQAKRAANGGLYLHHITPNLALGIGVPDKVVTLSITPKGTVVIDDTDKVLRNMAEDELAIRTSRNASIGEHQARIALGLDKPAFTAVSTPTSGGQQQPTEKTEELKDELDAANEEMQNPTGTEELKDELDAANEEMQNPTGTEDLNDESLTKAETEQSIKE